MRLFVPMFVFLWFVLASLACLNHNDRQGFRIYSVGSLIVAVQVSLNYRRDRK